MEPLDVDNRGRVFCNLERLYIYLNWVLSLAEKMQFLVFVLVLVSLVFSCFRNNTHKHTNTQRLRDTEMESEEEVNSQSHEIQLY